ncbi:MAG: hypothetical protein ACW96X_01470 [Promethearchaeota archaeon]|jgi:hypothetical protein
MKKEVINEQISRGDMKSLHISSVLIRSFSRNRQILMIPTLNFSKIKEKILETFIEGKVGNPP